MTEGVKTKSVEGDPPTRDEKEPSVFFHYCSAQTFVDIMRSQSLWMGRLSAMNDYMEHSWLRSIAIERIKQSPASFIHKVRDVSVEEQRLVSCATEILRLLTIPPKSDPYCVCFSADGDVLSQWRAYADDARGFAIGFSKESLQYGHKDVHPARVSYRKGEHIAAIELLMIFVRQTLGMEPDVEPSHLARDIHHAITTAAMICKNPKFFEEQEYRVVHEPEEFEPERFRSLGPLFTRLFVKDVELTDVFKPVGAHLLHFLAIPFGLEKKHEAVVEVVIGPRNPARQDKRILRRFLDSFDYRHVRIRESEATLR